MGSPSRWRRSPTKHNVVGWEIYSWRTWFITIGWKRVEIQINSWGRDR